MKFRLILGIVVLGVTLGWAARAVKDRMTPEVDSTDASEKLLDDPSLAPPPNPTPFAN